MMRIQISHEIGGNIPLIITLLLLSIEVGPIFFKMMISHGVYHYLLENVIAKSIALHGIEISSPRTIDGELYTGTRFRQAEVVLKDKRLELNA